MPFYLAIDGGGTKTEALLCDEAGHVLRRALVGSSNPNDIGRAASSALLRSLCAELADGKPIDAIFAGISGAIGHIEALETSLCGLAEQVRVGSDAMNLLALAGGDGCACLIAGTGSVCFARKEGALRRIGGWGYLLDGGGSGYDIGRDAISSVLRAHDGRGEPTALIARLDAAFGCATADAIPQIYAGGKAFIASFAPHVFAAAAEGDAVSLAILDRNADALSGLVCAASDWLGGNCRVLAGGSLLCAREELFDRLCKRIPHSVNLIRDDAPPVFGAYLEASGADASDRTVRETFLQDYAAIRAAVCA